MPSEAQDSLQSQAFLQLIDLLGEGPIMGLVNGQESIYFNETPLQNPDGTLNFQGVTTGFSDGSNNPVELLDQSKFAESPFSVGIQVKKNQPYTFAISNPNTTAVRVIMTVAALNVTNSETGDISGTSVQYKFQWSINGMPFEDIDLETENSVVTISGKSRSKYERSHTINLPSNWNSALIRVVRLTNDSTSAYLANDTAIDSYYEIISNRLIYPNSALMAISIDSKQFNSIPDRAYDVRGLIIRVPSNYTPDSRTYDGIWDGTFKDEWTDNPAWILFDLLTNKRYGLGQFISDEMVDTAMLYRISQYCDELVPDGFGGMEPRFTINTVLSNREECYKVISDITSVFRGMAYWNGSMTGFTQDSPSEPVMIFSQANVVDGMFNYTGSARKDRHSTVAVTYNDVTDFFRQKVEYVEDPELIAAYGVRNQDTLAFGCTTRGQAARVGRWILYTEKYESDFINFKVGLDATFVMPGDVVAIHDSNRAGKRAAGRLVARTSTSATLDAPITIMSSPATISFIMPDGTYVDRTVVEEPGVYETLTWLNPLTELPVENGLWLVSEQLLVPVLARVVAIAPSDNGVEFDITAVEHNPSKYAAIEEGLVLEERSTSIIQTGFVANPTDLQVVETTYLASTNTLASKLLISWFGNCTKYLVTYRGTSPENITNVTTVEVQGGLAYEVLNVLPGEYEITVTGVNPFGKRSATTSTFITAAGPTRLPSDVPSATVEQTVGGAVLTWETVSDIDVMTYEVRKSTNVGANWETADAIIRTATPSLQLTNLVVGEHEWQVKAVNTSGSVSLNSARATLTVPQIPALSGVSITPGFLCVYVTYDRPDRMDFAGVKVHISTTASFVPSALNQVYIGPDANITITKDAFGNPLDPNTTYYFKIAGYSSLGQANLNYSNTLSNQPVAIAQTSSVYLYQWAMTMPVFPTGSSTYNWLTGAHSSYNGGNGWTINLPNNPGTPGLQLFRATKVVSGYTSDESVTVLWDASTQVASVGSNGTSGTSGADAQILRLGVSAQVFTYDSTGAANPSTQTITFAANLVNMTGTATFVATLFDSSGVSLGTINLGGAGNVRTLTNAQFGSAQYCYVTAELNGISDSITVVRVRDGAAGKNPITGFLTNESAVVAADADGVVNSYSGMGGTFKVYEGTTLITPSNVAYSVVSGSQNGVNMTISSSGVYTVLNMSADTGFATLRAVYGGVVTDKVYSISKSRAGVIGINGADGVSGLQTATARLFQWALTLPAGPVGTNSYTWANGSFSYGGANGWTTTAGDSPAPGYTLYSASVNLIDSALQSTTLIQWSTATLSAVGYAGTNGTNGTDGATARSLSLTSSGQVFTFDANNVANPSVQIISLAANLQNLTGAVTFTAVPYDAYNTAGAPFELTGPGNTRQFHISQLSNAQYVIVTASLMGYSDQVTLVRLRNGADGPAGANGANGANGVTPVVGFLTNEAYSVSADAFGNVASFTGAGGTFKVYEGTTDVTGSSVGYAVVSSTGLTINIGNGGAYSVSAMSANTGTALLRAQYNGVVIDKVYSISKSVAGATAQLLQLTSTAQAFTFNSASQATPTNQTIAFTAELRNITGTATFTATPYDASGNALSAITLGGTGNTRTLTVAQFASAAYCVVTASLSGYSDTITVVKLKDGASGSNGSDGADGTDGVTPVVGYLTNESMVVPATASGVVSDFSQAGGTFKVFDGLTDKTGNAAVTYSVVGTTALTISIAATGVYTVTAMSADLGTATLRAVYNGVTIDKTYKISKSKTGQDGQTGAAGPAGATGAQGSSARVAFTRITGSPTPVAANISTSGDLSFPTQTQSLSYWGLPASWSGSDPNPSSTASLYQSDGIYNPATGLTTWTTPYLASLKVGTLSAITTNTGTLSVTGTMSSANGLFSVNENGAMTVKSATTGARLEVSNSVIKVYDSSGTLRVKIGDLNA